eukprot:CAMPEP_0182417068 /NCGR_PEP_ID=MMETSP1167-20130531/1481_1 /TAXON_ID=2988 /ORGANISM="Mallomonas Sp, Strain CCMP3275" /LENGTH=408 /DNA_ID=CAMNT_0024590349 /DNA_START=463 /DNA_END=1689 /DNA_ORIENTATION=-
MVECMKENMVDLRADCINVLDSMLSSLYGGCMKDIMTQCSSSDPSHVLPCLIARSEYLSAGCREELDSYLSDSLPCTEDASMYCKGHNTVSSVITCLQRNTGKGVLQNECDAMMTGLQNCRLQPQGYNGYDTHSSHTQGYSPGSPSGAEKPKPPPGGPGGPGDKPKPGPRDPEGDPAGLEEKPKPKPAPGDEKPKPKPGWWFGGRRLKRERESERERERESERNEVILEERLQEDRKEREAEEREREREMTEDDMPLPCWVRVQGGEREGEGEGYTGEEEGENRLHAYVSSDGERERERQELPWGEQPASIGLITILISLILLILSVVGLAWHRNGQTFIGLSDTVLAFARGYGQAPGILGEEREREKEREREGGYEMGDSRSAIMATALLSGEREEEMREKESERET